MAGILVYALHNEEGEFNKNSLGALSEAANSAPRPPRWLSATWPMTRPRVSAPTA